jgi:hypothetical protein
VPKQCLQNLHIGTRSDSQAGAGVPQFVRCQAVHADSFRGRVENPPNLTDGQVALRRELSRAGSLDRSFFGDEVLTRGYERFVQLSDVADHFDM